MVKSSGSPGLLRLHWDWNGFCAASGLQSSTFHQPDPTPPGLIKQTQCPRIIDLWTWHSAATKLNPFIWLNSTNCVKTLALLLRCDAIPERSNPKTSIFPCDGARYPCILSAVAHPNPPTQVGAQTQWQVSWSCPLFLSCSLLVYKSTTDTGKYLAIFRLSAYNYGWHYATQHYHTVDIKPSLENLQCCCWNQCCSIFLVKTQQRTRIHQPETYHSDSH